MFEFFHVTLILLTILIVTYLYRVIRGPTVFDRLLGLNGVSTKAIILLVLIGTIYERLDMFGQRTGSDADLRRLRERTDRRRGPSPGGQRAGRR